MARKVFASSTAIKFLKSAAIVGLLTGAFGLASSVQAVEVRHQDGEHLKPTGKGWGELDPSGLTAANAQKFSAVSTNGIFYHGGPVVP